MSANDIPASGTQLTTLLGRLAEGDSAAVNELFPLVYQQLRALAGAYMQGQGPAHTLQPTGLVHEAYLKLVGPGDAAPARDRAHFLALAATAMRQVLVDHARAKQTEKRGGGPDDQRWRRVTLSGTPASDRDDPSRVVDLLALEDALNELATLDPRKVRLVELKFFGGLSNEEAADILGVSRATVANDWTFARSWLARRLRQDLD